MYIKQIIIQGFKSYRDQTVIEPFDARHNVVVGRNGSGKSNFFYAIQFVLSDEFSYLRPEQRQSLLHEGTGPRVISAYVEIIFDNTDGRLPIDRDEVFLRRVIGSKKDQYFLNKKVVPRSDVMNLLESAGFSRSNPYYIVKQGKINQMATAPDSHRLKLLREVAGTRVYDERREESKLLLKESESRRDKVEECLRTIGERLSALEEEQEELKEYQNWDRMRRALEYTIHDQDLKEARRKLEDMDKKRNTSGEEQAKFTALMHRADEKVKVAAKKLKEAKAEVSSAREERDAYNAENQLLLKEKARLELTIRDLSDEVNGDDHSKERAEAELARLRETIAQKETSLAEILPQYEEMKRREDECSTDLAVKEQKRQELYARQGRSSQFASKDQRDQWIRSELRSLKKQLTDKEFQINQLTEDMRKDSDKKTDLQTRIQEKASDVDRYRSNIDDQTKGHYELRKQKDAMQSQRNELWRRENVLQQTLTSVKEDMHRTEQAMRSMVGKPVLNGRDSVAKVLATFRERGGEWQDVVDGYHGPVIKLFQCEQAIYTAVEVTAGNRLFHHVVDTDVIGTQILKEMNRQKLPGEVTFMPLNRLTVREIQYPQTDNAFPMVSRLKFDERFDRALRQIFGRTLICRNLELATQLARQHRLDCVTIEGDQAMSKGSLTGGFFNPSRSRLETQKLRVELQQQLDEAQTEMTQLLAKLEEIGQDINRTVTEMQKTETKSGKAKDVFEKVKTDIRLMKEELMSIERSQQPKERSLTTLRANLHSMQGTLESLEAELHQELMTVLSSDDQLQVDQLNDEIRRLELINKETFAARMRLEGEKNKLENLLANNLNRRLDELQQAMQELSVEDRKRQLELSSGELERCSVKLVETSKRLKEFDNTLTALQQKQSHSDSEVERWTSKRKEVQERMEDDAKDLEKMASRQNVLQQKIQEFTRKIRELGSLPSDAFGTMYQTLSSKQLFKKLEQCNAELKKYCNVNKKAGDQFIHFTEQKERLRERKEEQEKGYDKIMELMSVLEQRKYEAIFRTFKQVSAYFSEVFRKLVPQGHGQLIMKTDRDDQDEPSVQQPATVNTFTGVGIRVSFTSKSSDTREMNQLSGGQKSLVALAIIFAIQKCDPAPFYLFDEIDQALDPTHRQSVAAMIHDLCGKAQFITTTFRPELLQHANKFYGVKFRNKVSHVVCVSRDEAHDFVEDDTTHG